ncbi:MAG: glycosyltransferase [Pedosphaera sp.]|nr:glycosyltransferase [Pedosphaera sp.]
MSKRLKVLISAYACEPGKGSEPEVGWQWALQIARFHDVVVLTRENNRANIEAELQRLGGKQPVPQFVYHDRSHPVLDMKKKTRAVKWYYLLWQRSAHEIVTQLHAVHRFDLMHHVTFAGFRYPTAIWGHGVPTIWGPIGGIESVRPALLPWHHPPSLIVELLRGLNNFVQAAPFQVLGKRAGVTTKILASTRDMQATFQRLGYASDLMPTIGLHVKELPHPAHAPGAGALRLLFVGNLITLKGVDLALDALAASGTNATLTLYGSGNFQASAEQRVRRLGLADRVFFKGRLPRAEILNVYRDYDVFLFPSLHDTGGYALIEAMLNELPAICLDCGGPAVAVRADCGILIPLGSRASVVAGLAAAIRRYDADRELVAAHGRAARQVVEADYDWARKGDAMRGVYEATLRENEREPGRTTQVRYSGMGGAVTALHKLVSARGILVGALGLLLVGALGFGSMSYLKHEVRGIVAEKMPALRHMSGANATIDQGFKGTLRLLLTTAPGERKQIWADIQATSRSAESNLTAFAAFINSSADSNHFTVMMRSREEYLQSRAGVFSLIESNRQDAAMALCRTQLFPAYALYSQEADKLLDSQVTQATRLGEQAVTICTTTQVIVAAVAMLLFAIGFIIGFFK